MSNLRTTEIIMSAADYDAISNPKNPKNKAAMVRAQKNFSKLSKTSNMVDCKFNPNFWTNCSA